ncbi:MAG: hypothetical protein DMG21_14925 [Acidobacteria bacterium]|nr:MAG: hypothetical protein DMG21_14925 [Acidobacteriota bacterium]
MPPPVTNSQLAERAERALAAPRHLLEPFFKETTKEVLLALARNPNLAEKDLLRLLERKDLPGEVVREIAEHREAGKSYGAKLALARHPKTPRLVSLPLLKFLHLFDLVRVSQSPAVPADIKMSAEDAVLKKLESIPRGERITLARRASGRVAAGLLSTQDRELIRAALDNPFLSEAHLIRVLTQRGISLEVVEAVCVHEKWSRRYSLRLALVRHPLTPLPAMLAFLPDLAVNDLREVCLDRRMPEQVRKYVLAHCAERLNQRPPDL